MRANRRSWLPALRRLQKRRLPEGRLARSKRPYLSSSVKHFVRKHPTTRSQAETVWHQLDQTRIVEMSNLTAIPFAQVETKPGSKLSQRDAVGESQAKKEGFFFMLNNTQVAVIVDRVRRS